MFYLLLMCQEWGEITGQRSFSCRVSTKSGNGPVESKTRMFYFKPKNGKLDDSPFWDEVDGMMRVVFDLH